MEVLQYLLNQLETNNSKLQQIQSNEVQNNMYQVVKTNNSQQGIQMADNICKSYGLSREEMTQVARNFFHM